MNRDFLDTLYMDMYAYADDKGNVNNKPVTM